MKKILMVDTGRKYFNFKEMMAILDIMDKHRFDTLHWHFSDNEGFRIECDTCPEMVAENHLSKEEVKLIMKEASLKQIEILPELDSPGHLKPLLEVRPELRLKVEKSTLSIPNNALDITNPKAVELVLSLLDEYIHLFKESSGFHIGVDEFIDFDQISSYPDLYQGTIEKYGTQASGLELYIEYVNQLIEFVCSKGLRPHVWSDGLYRLNDSGLVEVDHRAVVHYWTRRNKNMAPLCTFIEKGHQLVNSNDKYMYFVLGENAGYQYPVPDKIIQGWQPLLFSDDQMMPFDHHCLLEGVEYCIWCDKPNALTVEEILFRLDQNLNAMNTVIANYNK
ncbi:family 20 glycosylhydrolase [Globicatella sanguinis]|uniref:family 20 glycosylhydrolase n=1 Tax=Globicatella sanguinis TaxID=13076 RepID=UPI002543F838|nr:family 20 glycosylhydrolase [Globicatella sanguinis]MDK7630910.1 family 20 glycosylhydrolase [Globicatella sanguinis]WIK66173.1 family 20 glycosylhydrolase [Globicatella sanguinis]WKT55578.1 family 20 glycosylhydrolase [Globicatella sanguinis]